jgi:hypothetical protein
MGIESPKYGTGGGGGGGETPAAGNDGDIQFNSGDEFAADTDLKWDTTSNELSLSDLVIQGVNSSATILDNQTTPLTIITLSTTSVKSATIEYSVDRGTERKTGQLLVVHNGLTSSIAPVSTDTGGSGISDTDIVFSSQISGSNLLIQYTSNSTGLNGVFKYSIRKWD